jgi:Fur family peroxide stress response transcriptional regulator
MAQRLPLGHSVLHPPLTKNSEWIIIIHMERTAEFVESRVEQMIHRCREAGMNVTPQRIAVYRALLKSTEHPTPEAIFNEVSPSMPSLSLATIYKSLEALESLGLVREVPVVSDSRRYDANLESHHHLVCTECGDVTDYYSEDLDSIMPKKKIRGFNPSFVSVHINGICADCQKRRVH